MFSFKLALPLAALPLALACEPPPLAGTTTIDLAPFVVDGGRLQGIARDPIGTDLHVLIEGRGMLQIDEDGALVAERPVGSKGLEDRPYRDLAVIGDGRFLLIADNEGYLYDELAETQRVHFCVEPGWEGECTDENGNWADIDNDGLCDWDDPAPTEPQPAEPDPVGTPVIQRNDALALVGAAIVAAPRFYEEGEQIEASLRTYDVATGDPTGSTDLSGLGLDIAGVASDGDRLIGVSANRLARFTLDGEKTAEATLDIDDAAGLLIDGDRALVLDRDSKRVVAFDIADLQE
ncbi:MAG: hypothetical protein Q8O67_00445 [Deltaproteobacteria bacterium]|nr:hypothetical protein [Deltaproteobacteria bacterium]